MHAVCVVCVCVCVCGVSVHARFVVGSVADGDL